VLKILCIIPARLKSTRLPEKPLLLIQNKPMIQWVYEAALSCQDIHKIIVATDAQEIADVIEHIGGHVEMTPTNLKTGSDRVAYVSKKFPEYDIVINLQGDEPFVTPHMLSALVAPYLNGEDIPMTTLAAPLDFDTDYSDPNTVKVIYDKNYDAIYFSRSAIPFFRGNNNTANLKMPLAMHLGLYAYQSKFLHEYTQFSQTPLESVELLEQLRAIENGYKIRVCLTDKRIIEVNTQEDLEKARQYCLEYKLT